MNTSFGVRFFLVLIVRLLDYYARHKANVDTHMASNVIDALEILLAVRNALAEANVPGPDPFVATNIGGGL